MHLRQLPGGLTRLPAARTSLTAALLWLQPAQPEQGCSLRETLWPYKIDSHPGQPAGGPWLCRVVVPSGLVAVVVASGCRVRVQPWRWIMTRWWNGHSSTQSRTLVGPPSALCRTWWTWQAAAPWVQPPGQRQCWSRRMTALRMPGGTVPA